MSKKKSNKPVRLCVVCRTHFVKSLLDRYVWNHKAGNVDLDLQQIMPGRGAYCCKDELCRERFLTRKQGWKRAFRLT